MKSTLSLAATIGRVGSAFAVSVLEWLAGHLGGASVDCFQQGMTETLEFSDKNQVGYGEAMY
jgi:hypothetical protein